MNAFILAVLACAAFLMTLPAAAQSPAPRYRFTPGQTLRFLIQRDPYFADPEGAMETVNPDAPYRPPIVERLMEKVLAVSADGTATLLVTLTAEPGFEDDERPQATLSRIVTMTASGKVLSVSGASLGNSPAEADLLRGIAALMPGGSARQDGLAVGTQRRPVTVIENKAPNHDGTLLQTTTAAETDRMVFDCRRGRLARVICTKTITASLTMTGRGRRGSDDFGHVVPNVRLVQTLTVEAQGD